MNFIKSILFLSVIFTLQASFSQEIIIQTSIKDPTSRWKSKNMVGFDLSEVAFMNWSAGGNSSISGLLKGNFVRKYKTENTTWLNELIVRYGLNKQDGVGVKKTDDTFQFSSTFGYRKDTISHWYSSAKFNFNTQFTNGYAYPNTEFAISKPFAPAYIFLGVGSEYINKKENLKIYISPFTTKNTLVLDQRLADQGAFGVNKATYDVDGNRIEKGKMYKTELGILLSTSYTKEVVKNIILEYRLSLYSDYVNKFGNIDVDWQMQLNLTVNEYVKANIGLHMIYDDDIKAKEEIAGEQVIVGPKLQLKQSLGIGIIYNFKTKKSDS